MEISRLLFFVCHARLVFDSPEKNKIRNMKKIVMISLLTIALSSCKDSETATHQSRDGHGEAIFILSSNRLSRALSGAAAKLAVERKNFVRNSDLVIDSYIDGLPEELRTKAVFVAQSEQLKRLKRSSASKGGYFSRTEMLDFLNDSNLSSNERSELETLGLRLESSSTAYSSTIGEDGSGYATEEMVSTFRSDIEGFENRIAYSNFLTQTEKSNLLNIASTLWQSMGTYVIGSEDMLAAMYPAEARCRFLCKLTRFIGAVVLSVAFVAIVGAAIAVPIALIVGPVALAVGAAVGGTYALYEAVFNNTCYTVNTSSGTGDSFECWPQ